MSTRPTPVAPRTLQLAIQLDEPARASLVQQEGPTVYSLCCRLDPDPDDAYQEIWEKVFVALPRFDPDGPASFRTWLVHVAHRHLVDRHRKRRRVERRRADLELVPPVSPRVEEHLSLHQRQQQLEGFLQRLPEPARRLVVLHHIEGLPLAEIASTEGCPVGTLKSRLHRIRARLLAWFVEEAP